MAARRKIRVTPAASTSTPVQESPVAALALLLGALLFFMGVYGFLRIFHVTRRGVPYPATGVLPSNVLFDRGPFFYARESDCKAYPQVYFELDGKTSRQPTEEEKKVVGQVEERCFQGFEEDRQKQLQYDRNLSAFLVFVGAGLLTVVKYWRLF